jgi:hypothetical protein
VQILHASEECRPQEPAVIRPLKRQGFIDGATLQALAPPKLAIHTPKSPLRSLSRYQAGQPPHLAGSLVADPKSHVNESNSRRGVPATHSTRALFVHERVNMEGPEWRLKDSKHGFLQRAQEAIVGLAPDGKPQHAGSRVQTPWPPVPERGDGDSRRHSAPCILHSASRRAPTKRTPSKTCVWRSRESMQRPSPQE